MSYFLNDELELLQESAREFAEQYVAPAVAGMEESNEFPRDLYLKAGELGFLSLIVPEQIGGAGMGLTAVGVVAEEIAKVSPAFAISFYVDSCMVSYLMESPNREVLLKKYLPGLMTGWTVMAAGITPPQGSTNIPEWPVLAKRDGDDWILNGSKLYVTNCGKADLVAFVGLTEDGEMRCFIVETSDPGSMTTTSRASSDWLATVPDLTSSPMFASPMSTASRRTHLREWGLATRFAQRSPSDARKAHLPARWTS